MRKEKWTRIEEGAWLTGKEGGKGAQCGSGLTSERQSLRERNGLVVQVTELVHGGVRLRAHHDLPDFGERNKSGLRHLLPSSPGRLPDGRSDGEHRQWRSVPAGARAHSSSLCSERLPHTAGPPAPFRRWRAAAEGILTGRGHLHSGLAVRRHWLALVPAVPGGGRKGRGAGRRGDPAAGGQARQRRGARTGRRRVGRSSRWERISG